MPMRDVHAREDEGGGDRLAVGALPEADSLRAALPEPGDQIAERLGLAVRPRPLARGTALGLSLKGVPCSNTSDSGPTDSTYSQPA